MPATVEKPIAYICAEYAIDDRLPIYAGGLGVLAGDILIEASEQNIPFIAVGLFDRKGFASYPPREKNGAEVDIKDIGFEIVKNNNNERIVICVLIGDNKVYAQAWKKSWGTASLYLLDTNIEENSDEKYKDITELLYPENFDDRMVQEIILGMGSVALCNALNVQPSVYHLNEGHMSFTAVALALQERKIDQNFSDALDAVRSTLVGTKHTILSGAGLFFTREQSEHYFGKLFQEHGVSHEEFFALGAHDADPNTFSTTEFLLRACIRTSAVSLLHAECEQKQCPECTPLIPITNGISKSRWMRPAFSLNMTDEELWEEHQFAKREFAQIIKERTGQSINGESLVIVWARRIAAYKRPLLIFQDLERLRAIIENSDRPVTLIFSGNAYGFDQTARDLLEQIMLFVQNIDGGRVVYVPGYSLALSKYLVSGADIWLNTPEYGMEASGTSGMKAGINGALQLSVADGWFAEVNSEDCFWTLDANNTAESLYSTLENQIIPAFYTRDADGYPRAWIEKMKKTRRIILEQYTAKRMLAEYVNKLYFPGV